MWGLRCAQQFSAIQLGSPQAAQAYCSTTKGDVQGHLNHSKLGL